jgi:hypothetical protein
VDIVLQLIPVLGHFYTVTAPGSVPLGVSPWVSESHQSDWSSFLIFQLKNIADSVGMVQDKPRWLTFQNMWSVLAISFDAAAHQTVVLSTLLEEGPEAIFSTIMLLDHLVWECSCFLVSDQDLLWLETSQLLNTFINVSSS